MAFDIGGIVLRDLKAIDGHGIYSGLFYNLEGLVVLTLEATGLHRGRSTSGQGACEDQSQTES